MVRERFVMGDKFTFLKECAVDPDLIVNLERLNRVLDAVGVGKGRLLCDYPKNKWIHKAWQQLKENCSEEISLKRAEQRLRDSKDSKLFKTIGRTYTDGKQWIDNAFEVNDQNPFEVLVSEGSPSQAPNLLQYEDLEDEHPLWKANTDKPIARDNSEELAFAASRFLKISREIVFVDPFFSTRKSSRKTAPYFIKEALNGKKVSRLEFHLSAKTDKPEDIASQIFYEHIEFLKKDIFGFFRSNDELDKIKTLPIDIIRWDKIENGEAMHPRYILTEQGGMRYDYGIARGNHGETCDVSIFDKNSGDTYETRWSQYCASSTDYKFMQGYRLKGDDIMPLTIQDGCFKSI